MAEMQQNPGPRQGAKARQRKKSTRIDMTAMVDVAFLLLTFFILTTTLARPSGLKLTLPETKGDPIDIQCSRMMEIYPGENGKVYWYAGCDRETISTTGYGEQGIRSVIRTRLAENPELIITLKPTGAATYANLVDILDEMKITGAPRYALAPLADADLELLNSKNLK
ncbi:MAG: biopolymer transporter ExbD [Bacteroidia bacterium]